MQKHVQAIFIVLFGILRLYSQDDVNIHFYAQIAPNTIARGSQGTLIVSTEIPQEFHITDPTTGLFIIKPEEKNGIRWDDPQFPEGEKDAVGLVYHNEVEVRIPLHVKRKAIEGITDVAITVTYQSCDELNGICFPPMDQTLEAEFIVVAEKEVIASPGAGGTGITDRLSHALHRGSWLAFLLVFVGGILTSLTPCVYPMIPITLAVIGAQASGSKMKGFILSLFYVLGIAITFSSLGIIAAKTGGLFGSITQHPVVVIFIAVIFFTMGLSMLGAFIMQMPPSLASRLRGKQRKGYFVALLTGLVAGFIVSPCISPLLVVILAWVAQSGSLPMGFGLLFTFALGLGILFLIIGTFSGVLKNLPRTGGWAELIEKGFGLLLIILAVLFLKPILPVEFYHGLWAVIFIFFGTYIGAFGTLGQGASGKQKARKATGVIAVAAGVFLIFFIVTSYMGYPDFKMVSQPVMQNIGKSDVWMASDREAFRNAEIEDKLVLIDFYADWCAACHELDEKTWPDPEVQNLLGRIIAVKLDLTKYDGQTKAIQKKYNIIGMPTVILFSSDGHELIRFEGFQSPQSVVNLLMQFL